MTAGGQWWSSPQFAAKADVNRRSAARILGAAAIGKPWAGFALEVREVRGRGGKAGSRYEVSARSARAAIEGLERTSLGVGDHGLPAVFPTSPHTFIARALLAPTPRDRAEIVRAAAVATGKSVRTIERAVAKVREGGAVAASRKRPRNAGEPRVAISRAFMKFAAAGGWTNDQIWAAHNALKDHVRSLWASQAANAGWRVVARLTREKLARDLAADLGETMTPTVARNIFDIPRRFVESERTHSWLNLKRTDAKATYDARPGTLLDLNACGPMEMVYGDVHHLDVKLRREDGEAAFCVKMVAWMDAGNRRVFARFFNMPKGRMIRQDDVAETFALMARHPEWGMPQTLYIDNGSEYKMLDHMSDAFKLMEAGGYTGTIVHSTAYNPRGKAALESFFQHFERYYLSLIPGYAGGDRQRQKTANQGREIRVADWHPDDVQRLLHALLDRYNADERDTLGRRTPDEVFRTSARAANWSPTTASLEALAFGHAKRETRTVRQGLIQVGGKQYRLSGPAILADTVTVFLSPWMSDGVAIEHGGDLIFAPLALRHHPLDPEGARESAALKGEFNREIEALGALRPKVDPLAELLQYGPAVLDLDANAKNAFRQALSPKAQKAAKDEHAARLKAENATRTEILSRIPGPEQSVRKTA